MCGILGIIKPNPISDSDIESVRRGALAMAHRGPDGSGEFMEMPLVADQGSHLYMAMRRLSIIDLSHGWQPLKSEDGNIAVIVNGEIYNYIELRQELEKRGHRFATHSDCEVLVHLYEDYGVDFVHQLRGMFAFALWDARKRRLMLGRDRMGEKPLYLYVTSAGILFASELKVLLASGQVPFAVDPIAIQNYLHYSWIPEPRTGIAGVTKLQAGHVMVINVDSWTHQEKCYWKIEDSPALSGNPIAYVREELDSIGTLIVRSDVPIGVSLSGGFDSSLIAALAVKNADTEVHAFSLGYEGSPGQDERKLAAQVAADLGMRFHSLVLSHGEMVRNYPKMAFYRDDPIADLAGSGYFAISQAAHESGCPVLFQGQGGDELLWGYPWAIQAVMQSMRKLSGSPVTYREALLANLPRGISRPQIVRFTYFIAGLIMGWRSLSPGKSSPEHHLVAYDLTDGFQISQRFIGSSYTKKFKDQLESFNQDPSDFFQYFRDGTRIDIQILSLLCRGYLLENGLAQGDRLSMANSVELRLPLVDYRLAQVITGIQKYNPVYFKKPKSLLIDASRDLVPEYVINRPKRGFTPPVAVWVNLLKKEYGNNLVEGALVQDEILDPKYAFRLSQACSRFNHRYDIFQKYLALEFWYQGMKNVVQQSTI